MMFTERAPAKINLSLHVVRRRPDGYHDLESLVAFAGSGDVLTLVPGEQLTLTVAGPTAGAAGPDGDNLVLRAARALAERVGGLRTGAFHLIKRLPVAAGIGGGSSDAAAALRLLATANGLSRDDPRLYAAAQATGADVPVCLAPRARMMRGIGEQLGPPVALPALAAVLVNPGIGLETRHVFGRLGLVPGDAPGRAIHPPVPGTVAAAALVDLLRATRNDMEAAAGALVPAIAHVLDALGAITGCRLARMSGSGTTCFALFGDCREASRAARLLRRDHPGWWVKSTVLR